MTTEQADSTALEVWREFCIRMYVAESGVPLFDTDSLVVRTAPHGRSGRAVLQRSTAMDNLIKREASKLTGANSNQFDGLIYLVYRPLALGPMPLYVGKAETTGRMGGLSANIKSLSKSGLFARWGYGRFYHMGELSAAVLGADRPADAVHRRWAEALFTGIPSTEPTLKEPVFFWMKAWSPSWPGPGHTEGTMPVRRLERVLIGIANQAFPQTLLNVSGVRQQRPRFTAQ